MPRREMRNGVWARRRFGISEASPFASSKTSTLNGSLFQRSNWQSPTGHPCLAVGLLKMRRFRHGPCRNTTIVAGIAKRPVDAGGREKAYGRVGVPEGRFAYSRYTGTPKRVPRLVAREAEDNTCNTVGVRYEKIITYVRGSL